MARHANPPAGAALPAPAGATQPSTQVLRQEGRYITLHSTEWEGPMPKTPDYFSGGPSSPAPVAASAAPLRRFAREGASSTADINEAGASETAAGQRQRASIGARSMSRSARGRRYGEALNRRLRYHPFSVQPRQAPQSAALNSWRSTTSWIRKTSSSTSTARSTAWRAAAHLKNSSASSSTSAAWHRRGGPGPGALCGRQGRGVDDHGGRANMRRPEFARCRFAGAGSAPPPGRRRDLA